MSMNFNNLVKALTCNNSADEADNLGCGNKRCKYRDVDGACDIVGMCEDAAIAIKQLAAIMDTLGDDYDLDRLRELVEADRDGRCVVLPCKVGDKLFYEDEGEAIDEVVEKIVVDIETDGGIYSPRDIGYSVYLSAEAALKAREQDG